MKHLYWTALVCVTMFACTGCESFRWGERSYQEVEQLNQQQREVDGLMFKPGTVIYSQ